MNFCSDTLWDTLPVHGVPRPNFKIYLLPGLILKSAQIMTYSVWLIKLGSLGAFFSKITSVFLGIAENYRFLAFFPPKIYLLLGYNFESTQVQANTSTEQIKTPLEAFFSNFDPKLKMWIFEGHVKNFQKKMWVDFFEKRIKR